MDLVEARHRGELWVARDFGCEDDAGGGGYVVSRDEGALSWDGAQGWWLGGEDVRVELFEAMFGFRLVGGAGPVLVEFSVDGEVDPVLWRPPGVGVA